MADLERSIPIHEHELEKSAEDIALLVLELVVWERCVQPAFVSGYNSI
ncbi:pyridine nucleotide-disulphide oxidoreductase [Histoplasma capsulatum H143]|uniref:Pyridine nucleotide-disulphide oxidoreductase n=1 Tax=Ajellomyces capsulatus (strain H143) TaxID=544712 RepID=C6HNN1_AJECH|nr:pyridine nucleotide-disulphide oxidoreductase [Histoplasma capsulatum H143]